MQKQHLLSLWDGISETEAVAFLETKKQHKNVVATKARPDFFQIHSIGL